MRTVARRRVIGSFVDGEEVEVEMEMEMEVCCC